MRRSYIYLFYLFIWGPVLSGQDSPCLECHEVSPAQSVHAGLECLTCHNTMDLDEHIEDGTVPEFSQEEACGGCHAEEWQEHATSIHGLRLGTLYSDLATCVDCHGAHGILPAEDSRSLVHPANLVTTCGRCHADKKLVERYKIPIQDPVELYKLSVHYRVLEASGFTSATCNDCHGTHNIQNLRHARSTINFWNVAETCGRCHTLEHEQFKNSDHWIALQMGARDAPTCITCHGEHAIMDPTGRYDHIKKRDLADRTCLKCHSSQEMAQKYGLSMDVTGTYRDSYHGLAVLKGDEDAAACFDCHGVHQILGVEHTNSAINAANLMTTCGKCHPKATAQFARTYTHVSVLFRETPVEDIVRSIYLVLIVGIIGFMVIHNGIVLVSHLWRRSRIRRVQETYLRRYSTAEVWQHLLTIISFFTLVVTGFALKFPSAGWAQLLAAVGLTESARSLVHRIAAVVMIAVTLWHVAYFLVSPWARYRLRFIIPGVQDVKDLILNLKNRLTGTDRMVAYGYFDYTEKMEYWALVWGTVIMILTGLILWFPTSLGEATPAWLIKVAEAVHYWEAWLATLAVLVWHFFFVIFHPKEYPGSSVMFTGKMSKNEWIQKHPKFYRELELELERYRSGELDYAELSPVAKTVLSEESPKQE